MTKIVIPKQKHGFLATNIQILGSKLHTSFLKKIDFWPKNSQIYPISGIFCQISAFLTHVGPCLAKKNVNKVPRWFFCYMGTKTFVSSCKIRVFGPKTVIFSPKYAFLVILSQILAFLAHLVPCPTKKQCEQGA